MNMESSNSQSYKELIKENKRLNSELRKIGSELNRNHGYSIPKILDHAQMKRSQHLKIISSSDMELIRSQELKSYRALVALQQGEQQSANHSKNRSSDSKFAVLDQESESRSQKFPQHISKDIKKKLQIGENTKQKSARKYENLDHKVAALLKNSNFNHSVSEPLENFQIQKNSEYLSRTREILSLKPKTRDENELLAWIRQNIIGFNTSYLSSVHLQLETVYVDHTATNRPFQSVEVLVDHAKLFAANPHTEFSKFGKFSTQLMHYARDSMLRSFSVTKDKYVVLPTGGGSTGAIEKTVHFLKSLEVSDEKWKDPKIYLTPYEHHSNILPWVEFYNKIQVLAHLEHGTLDMDKIFEQVSNCESQSIIITVSLASNVTSKITHIKELNEVVRKIRIAVPQKNIVFAVDCAAFCCHHDLNLAIYDQIDFAFLSPHKNLGGAESCGVLVARNSLMASSKPTFPGGGTVKFVKGYSKDDVMYEVDVFSREIAGTPPYFGFYRAALSFQLLKNVIGYDYIHQRQLRNTKQFFAKIQQANKKLKEEGSSTQIVIYGDKDFNERANVVTFNFQFGPYHFLQHSLASLILTDIFGIQIRSGCFCAGPYGINLLGVHEEMINIIEQEVEAGIMINKPGYLRLDLTFYLEDYEVDYIANALILIAKYWKNFLKLYTVCNDGQVVLLPIFKKNEKQIYSLSQIDEAWQVLKEEAATKNKKLQNRRKTLEEQLKVGAAIAQKPVDFLKKFKQSNQKNEKIQSQSSQKNID